MSTPTAAPSSAPTPQAPAAGAAQAQPGKAGPAAAASPTPAEVRKLKLKLDGKDVEMPESEVIALAQKSGSSGKRFEEAQKLRAEAEAVLRFAKENPAEFFARTGMNARQWAEEYLIGELKREQMSPEQRKAAENEEKLKKYEAEKKAADDKKKSDELAALQKKHAERYDALFVEALSKSGLPKTPYTVKRMAELQLVNIRKKLELTPDQLAKVVREDYIAEQKALFGSTEGDALLEMLGPDVVKKLSKAQIAKLKAKGVGQGAGSPPPKRQGEKPMTWREYQRRNRRLP